MDQNKMQKLAGVISESRIREPYKQPCFGKLTLEVKRANTRPYSAFSIRSNARWFPQTTSDGRKVEVSNTMFDPRELGVLCAQLSGIEPENGYFRIPVKTETLERDGQTVTRYVPDVEKLADPLVDRLEIAQFASAGGAAEPEQVIEAEPETI